MAKYHGRSGRVYVSTTGTAASIAVCDMSEWTLALTRGREEVTAFCDTNKEYVMGHPDTRGTISGFWTDDDATLFTAADSTDGCKIYLYPSSDALTKYWYGPAWLDITDITTGVGGPVTMRASFVANGAWGRK